jgi:dTMP kinase
VRSEVVSGLTEERRALIGRYMLDAHAPPAGAEREEPMRREALEVTRQAPVEHERAVAVIATEVRRKTAEDRARREALEEVVRRAAVAEAQARRQADEERARYEALEAAARRAAAERTSPRQAGTELTARLVDALTRLQESSDATAARLERLTRALVLLSISIAAFTIVALLKG